MNVIYDNIIFSLQKAGGISVVWYELLKRLLEESTHNLKIIDYNSENIYRGLLQVPEDKILADKSVFSPKIGRYFSPIIDENIENAIFHSSYYRISSNSKHKNITTVHDFTYEYYRKGLSQKIHSCQKRNAVEKASGIICVSENTKRDLLKFYPWVDEKKVAVIYNGVDSKYQKLDDISLYKEIIPYAAKSYLLYVGDRSSSYKNFDKIVQVALSVKLPLVIVGTKPSKQEYDYLSSVLGASSFKVLSGLGIEQLNIIYNAAFCLLYPSLYEGFGIPILEAQSAGCPVICSNISSIPEVAGDSAFLLQHPSSYHEEMIDIIQALKNGTENLTSRIEKGFENSKRFSWDICFNQTLNFYSKIVNQ